jgi:hypothetical protein
MKWCLEREVLEGMPFLPSLPSKKPLTGILIFFIPGNQHFPNYLPYSKGGGG